MLFDETKKQARERIRLSMTNTNFEFIPYV